jgi:four helix bundle protein
MMGNVDFFDIGQRSAFARRRSWTLRSTIDGRWWTYNVGDLMGRSDEVARHYDLQDRLIDLAVRITRVCDSLPPTRAGKHVAGQLLRCGTAAAPLHAEANSAESRKDFIHKLGICLKELRETMAWLRYLKSLKLGDEASIDESIDRTDRATAIIFTSIRTAKRNEKLKS